MKSIKEEISSVLSLFPISRNYHLSNSPHKVEWREGTYLSAKRGTYRRRNVLTGLARYLPGVPRAPLAQI